MKNYNNLKDKESILKDSQLEFPIDIVVVTFNRLPYLKKCIASIVASTEVPYRIFVYDDLSSDGTQEWLLKMRNRGVVDALILSKINQGTAIAFNDIIKSTTSDWFAMCNDDMYFHRGWDIACLDMVNRYEQCGVINFFDYSRYELDDNVTKIADDVYDIPRAGLGSAFVSRVAFNKAKGFILPKGKKMGYMTTPFCERIKKHYSILGTIPHYATNMDVVGCTLNEFEYIDKNGYFDTRAKAKNFTSGNRKKYKPE